MLVDLRVFSTVFPVIFAAELPDKTALAALVLATRYRPLPVFLGAALALAVQSLVAVAAGGLLSLFPARPVHVGAGLLFVASAVLMFRRKEEVPDAAEPAPAPAPKSGWRAFAAAFGVVFIAEWGDLTQLGTAALAARYRDPVTVFVASTLALWAVAGLAVLVGNRAGATFSPSRTAKVAAVLFALVGVALIAGVL